VTLLPNRPAFAGGPDSMKVYGYAARGAHRRHRPPVVFDDALGVRCVDTPHDLARAVIEAAGSRRGDAEVRRAWAATQRWRARWPAWSAAVLGPGTARPARRARFSRAGAHRRAAE
jgi:hypothetical protein